MKDLKRQDGFTLVEMMVVVAVLTVVMVTVSGLLLNSFKASSRVDVTDKVEQNGQYALNEIRNNFLTSNGINVTCGVGGSITYVNQLDGNTNSLQCVEGASIASISGGRTTNLTVGVSASNCSNFVTCDFSPEGLVTSANIGFTLSAGTPNAGLDSYVSRSFETKVAVRSY